MASYGLLDYSINSNFTNQPSYLCMTNICGVLALLSCPQRCNCTQEGSSSEQCDMITGQCSCKSGFRGFSCDACDPGFFGFPNCKACLCDPAGSTRDSCSGESDICECDEDGECNCKVRTAVFIHCFLSICI